MAIPNPQDVPLLSITEAAEAIGLPRSSAYRAADDGSLPVVIIGKRRWVPTAALRRMVHLDEEPEA